MMKGPTRRLSLLLFLSVLLHILSYFGLKGWWSLEPEPLVEEETITVAINLEPPVEKKEKEESVQEAPSSPQKEEQVKTEQEPEETPPAPISNADDFASDNQNNRDQNKIDFGKLESETKAEDRQEQEGEHEKDKQANQEELLEQSDNLAEQSAAKPLPEKSKPPSYKELVDIQTLDMANILEQQLPDAMLEYSQEEAFEGANSESMEERLLNESLETLENQGGMDAGERDALDDAGNVKLLSENQLREQVVESPFSEKKAKELRMANRYLDRMSAQVKAQWINPYEGSEKLNGVIAMEIDQRGFLVYAEIRIPSGDRILDVSVLDAIRAVKRFAVPEDPNIVKKYYTNLRFHYSSIEEQPELMPFE